MYQFEQPGDNGKDTPQQMIGLGDVFESPKETTYRDNPIYIEFWSKRQLEVLKWGT